MTEELLHMLDRIAPLQQSFGEAVPHAMDGVERLFLSGVLSGESGAETPTFKSFLKLPLRQSVASFGNE